MGDGIQQQTSSKTPTHTHTHAHTHPLYKKAYFSLPFSLGCRRGHCPKNDDYIKNFFPPFFIVINLFSHVFFFSISGQRERERYRLEM